MEKISIQSTYTQVSLYARLSGPTAAKKPGADNAALVTGAELSRMVYDDFEKRAGGH